MIVITYFLLGIFFSIAILPIIEELVALILTLCELGKTILTLKVSKNNNELKKLLGSEEEEEPVANAIGFVVDPVKYEDEEDDEDDEEEEYD